MDVKRQMASCGKLEHGCGTAGGLVREVGTDVARRTLVRQVGTWMWHGRWPRAANWNGRPRAANWNMDVARQVASCGKLERKASCGKLEHGCGTAGGLVRQVGTEGLVRQGGTWMWHGRWPRAASWNGRPRAASWNMDVARQMASCGKLERKASCGKVEHGCGTADGLVRQVGTEGLVRQVGTWMWHGRWPRAASWNGRPRAARWNMDVARQMASCGKLER